MSDRGDPQSSLEELLTGKLSVTSFKIQGAERTSLPLLNRVLQPVLSTGGDFEGVVTDISTAVDRLRASNCFKGVDAFIDNAEDRCASVVFTLNEKSPVQLATGTSIETTGERDASVEGSLLVRNIRGAADTLSFTVAWMGGGNASKSFAKSPSNSFTASYSRPYAFGLDSTFFTDASISHLNHAEASSYNLRSRSADAGFSTPLGKFTMASVWRNLTDVDSNASSLIREDAKHTWKTSFQHEIEMDMRDNIVMPTKGIYASFLHEHTLPLGDVRFSRLEGILQTHIPFVANGALSLSVRSGATIGKMRVPTPDRFFIGGANSFRGFKSRGVGPSEGKDAVGGDIFYVATAMLSLPLPAQSLLSHLFNARVHAFASAGDLTEVNNVKAGLTALKGHGLQNALVNIREGVYQGMRVSVGLGVALETTIGRVELNACQAIRSSVSDQPQIGFQLGISQSFL